MPSFPFWEVSPESGEPALISNCSPSFSNTLHLGLIQLQNSPDFPFGNWLRSLYTGRTSLSASKKPLDGPRLPRDGLVSAAGSLAAVWPEFRCVVAAIAQMWGIPARFLPPVP